MDIYTYTHTHIYAHIYMLKLDPIASPYKLKIMLLKSQPSVKT